MIHIIPKNFLILFIIWFLWKRKKNISRFNIQLLTLIGHFLLMLVCLRVLVLFINKFFSMSFWHVCLLIFNNLKQNVKLLRREIILLPLSIRAPFTYFILLVLLVFFLLLCLFDLFINSFDMFVLSIGQDAHLSASVDRVVVIWMMRRFYFWVLPNLYLFFQLFVLHFF